VVSERLDPRVRGIGPLWSTLRRALYPRAARLVVQTEAVGRLFRSWLPGRIDVVPNPVLPPAEGREPAELALSRPAVVAMGRLHPQKGFDTLLRAAARVLPRYPEWSLTILGEGSERPALQRLMAELSLTERVQLPGRVRVPGPVLGQAEIFVLSSRTEGFPNALCEAMARGLAVVATDCPSGPADIITPGTDGVLVPVDDPGALAEALEILMEDHNLRLRLQQQAPEIRRRYALERILAAWDATFAAARADRV
jgi:glycosyltransferase involved in cell wall biosynthesis